MAERIVDLPTFDISDPVEMISAPDGDGQYALAATAQGYIDELCNALRHALAVNEELRRRLKSSNQHLDRVDHLEDEALKTLRLYRPDQPLRDKCEVCNGWRGGVPGNEHNVKLGRKSRKIMCDDCCRTLKKDSAEREVRDGTAR